MFNVISCALVIRISRKVSCLFCSHSMVKVMFCVVLFIVCRMCFFVFFDDSKDVVNKSSP